MVKDIFKLSIASGQDPVAEPGVVPFICRSRHTGRIPPQLDTDTDRPRTAHTKGLPGRLFVSHSDTSVGVLHRRALKHPRWEFSVICRNWRGNLIAMGGGMCHKVFEKHSRMLPGPLVSPRGAKYSTAPILICFSIHWEDCGWHQGISTNDRPSAVSILPIPLTLILRYRMASTINYARDVFGIHSVAAAVIFAVLYAFLLPYYIWRAFRNPTYVLIILSLFCASELFNASLHRDQRRLTIHPRLSPGDRLRNAGNTRGLRNHGIEYKSLYWGVDCLQRWLLRFAILRLYPRPRSVSYTSSVQS